MKNVEFTLDHVFEIYARPVDFEILLVADTPP